MQKIVHGILFEGKPRDDAYEVRTWRANGVMERSVRQCISWNEIGPVPPLDKPDPIRDAKWIEEKRVEALERSAKRAKQMCRRVIISEGFTELLTLTYRENQSDRELCKRHFKLWVKRMKRALGEFRYCASFEVQERGAMHVHIACHKLPQHANYHGVRIKAWRLGTEAWRGIVGADNGLCFVGGRSRTGAPRAARQSLAKVAAYVSKYITKDYKNAPEETNRYSRSNGAPIPPSELVVLTNTTLLEVIAVTFELGEGDCLVSHRLGKWNDGVWLVTERKREPLH